jgi:glutaconate CoA-transferase subunit A
MTRAASRGVILTAEAIVPGEEIARDPGLTAVPGFMVRAVVEAPGGAWPCSCHPAYGVDEEGMRRYMELSASPEGLGQYLQETDAGARRR